MPKKYRNKGELMKLVYTEQELRNIDAGLPKYYWDGIDPTIQVDTFSHVMNYNEDSGCFGRLENMFNIAKEREIQLEEV